MTAHNTLDVLWLDQQTAPAAQALPLPAGLNIRYVTGQPSEDDIAWAQAVVKGGSAPPLTGERLRHVVVPFAGVREEVRAAVVARGGVTIHNSHFNAAMVAQQAVALMLACTNRIVTAHERLARGDWGDDENDAFSSIFLPGKVALLLGFGHIGSALVAPLQALGLEVRALRRKPIATPGVYTYEPGQLHAALAEADVVIVSLPATSSTIGLLGERELAQLHRKAVIVNVGRGTVIDEAALFDALSSGRIFAAGIDVWYSYPTQRGDSVSHMPSSKPFHELPNVVMSPHRSNDVFDWQVTAAKDTLETLAALARGEPRNEVDLTSGY